MPLSAHIATALRASPQRMVVTGASGWLGRATLDLLHDALGDAFGARVACFGSQSAEIRLSPTRSIEQRPLSELGALPRQPTLLLHFAFLGKERAETMPEAEYRAANRAIRQTVLDALDPIGVEAAFVASSGAARHADDPSASPAMRLYGSLKRADEDAFASWAEAHETSATIGRIFNISGPQINKLGSYALSSFLIDALAGGPVVVRARHDVRRGYVAIRELMSLVFALLLEAGVLTEGPRRARQRAIRANTNYFLFDELRSIALKTFALKEPLQAALQPFKHQIQEAFVFGSIAKQTDTAQSDIDLIIIGNAPLLAITEVISQAEQALKRTINMSLYEPDEWAALKSNDPVLVQIANGPKIRILPDDIAN